MSSEPAISANRLSKAYLIYSDPTDRLRQAILPRLQRLARFYSVPVDQLLPRDAGPMPSLPRRDDETSAPTNGGYDGGKVSIDLNRLEALDAPEKDLISRYVGMIQLQRGDFNGRMLTIRAEDVRALARLFEKDADSMRDRMAELGIRI